MSADVPPLSPCPKCRGPVRMTTIRGVAGPDRHFVACDRCDIWAGAVGVDGAAWMWNRTAEAKSPNPDPGAAP